MSSPAEAAPAVIITGSSSGIGAACAAELDRRGFRVFAGVRSEADGQRLQDRASPRLRPVLLDVTDQEAIAAAAASVGGALGSAGLGGLVNNAGIVLAGPLEVLPIEELRRQFEVNVFGPMAVTQAFLPLLRAARGRIVNISSISGRVAAPYLGPYAASKFALEAFSDSLRLELRRCGVSVSLVEPGNVATPIWEKSQAAADELVERLEDRVTQEQKDLYEADLHLLRETTERFAAGAMPVEKVVRAVVHALCARRPKARYPIGWRTRAASLLLACLPAGLRDRIVQREMGLA
jgi:NAD(P)-dependent dehydrogenase (short-subunit alcohol dehydrogenase family)